MEKKINKICPKCGGDLTISYNNLSGKLSSACQDCGFRYEQKPLDWIEAIDEVKLGAK